MEVDDQNVPFQVILLSKHLITKVEEVDPCCIAVVSFKKSILWKDDLPMVCWKNLSTVGFHRTTIKDSTDIGIKSAM